MSGIPGAGKSYVSSSFNDGAVEARVVNTDKYIELGKDLDTSLLLNKNSLVLYVNSMLPLIVDSTSSNSSTLFNRVGLLESFGYDVGMVWVNTNLETALDRASLRSRHVDPEYIRQSYEQSLQNKDYYSKRFELFYEIDNNDGMLTDQVILKAFRAASKFYTSPVRNPVGQRFIKMMQQNNWKYLSDGIFTMDQVRRGVNSWYGVSMTESVTQDIDRYASHIQKLA